jgi:hypothetical protein
MKLSLAIEQESFRKSKSMPVHSEAMSPKRVFAGSKTQICDAQFEALRAPGSGIQVKARVGYSTTHLSAIAFFNSSAHHAQETLVRKLPR